MVRNEDSQYGARTHGMRTELSTGTGLTVRDRTGTGLVLMAQGQDSWYRPMGLTVQGQDSWYRAQYRARTHGIGHSTGPGLTV